MSRFRRSLPLAALSALLGSAVCPPAVTPLLAQERFPDPPPQHGLYSDAVRVGDLVFLSGVVAGDPDPTAQFTSVFQRIGSILEDAGSSLAHVVDLTTYHIDMHEHIDAFIDVKNRFMPNLSSWTAVGVTELYSDGVFIEVKVIAAVADGS